MFLEEDLCEELAYTLHIEELDNVNLIGKLLRSFFMPFKTIHSSLVPLLFLAGAATAESL